MLDVAILMFSIDQLYQKITFMSLTLQQHIVRHVKSLVMPDSYFPSGTLYSLCEGILFLAFLRHA